MILVHLSTRSLIDWPSRGRFASVPEDTYLITVPTLSSDLEAFIWPRTWMERVTRISRDERPTFLPLPRERKTLRMRVCETKNCKRFPPHLSHINLTILFSKQEIPWGLRWICSQNRPTTEDKHVIQSMVIYLRNTSINIFKQKGKTRTFIVRNLPSLSVKSLEGPSTMRY